MLIRSLLRVASHQVPLKHEPKMLARKITDYPIPPFPPVPPNSIDPDCPINRHYLNARIDPSYPGESHITLNLEGRFIPPIANSANSMHGGVIAILHDLAACKAVSSLDLAGETVTMSILYHAPIVFNNARIVTANGEVTSQTRRYCHVRTQIRCDTKLASESFQILNVRPK